MAPNPIFPTVCSTSQRGRGLESVLHGDNSLCIINKKFLQHLRVVWNTNEIKKKARLHLKCVQRVAAVRHRHTNQTVQTAEEPVIVNRAGKSHRKHFYRGNN